MALCGTSVRSVHAGASSRAVMTAATPIVFVMYGFLESDTETSRKCATTRIVEIIDTARGDTRQLCMDFRVVAGVISPQDEIVAGEEHTGIPCGSSEARQVERVADGNVLQPRESSIFDVTGRELRGLVDLRRIGQR